MIATAPAFFATPAIMAEVARARTVVLLIGGYDGSGNYGDIAQLDAALGLLERLDPDLLLLPVLERSRLADHRALGEDFLHPPDRALFFDPGEGREDDLLPVPAPADLAFAVCYLYGGGYLNPSWGERKLAMLRAAETLLAGGGATKVCRLSSGLQVDADWVAGLAAADAEALRSFELLGVRDRVSGDALAALGSGSPILDTADDVVGILRRLPLPDPRLNSDGKIHVNLHLAEHGWVTERPDAMASFYGDLVAELGHCAGLPVVAQPLIAYLDRQVSDRPTVERLGKACAARGVELAEPRVLGPRTSQMRWPRCARPCSRSAVPTTSPSPRCCSRSPPSYYGTTPTMSRRRRASPKPSTYRRASRLVRTRTLKRAPARSRASCSTSSALPPFDTSWLWERAGCGSAAPTQKPNCSPDSGPRRQTP